MPAHFEECASALHDVWLCNADIIAPGVLQPVDTSANYTGNVTTPSGASVERLLYGVSQKLLGVAFINGQVCKHYLVRQQHPHDGGTATLSHTWAASCTLSSRALDVRLLTDATLLCAIALSSHCTCLQGCR